VRDRLGEAEEALACLPWCVGSWSPSRTRPSCGSLTC